MELFAGVFVVTLMVTTLKKNFMASLCWGLFWGISGPIFAYVHFFLDICSILCHEILYRCSWYNPDYH